MIEMFFWLIVGHCLADFALQPEAMAAAKRRTSTHACPWWIALAAHAMIHAGFVAAITSSIVLGLLEFALHFVIDFAKCEGLLGFRARLGDLANKRSAWSVDQGLHVGCKLAWAALS